MIITATYPGICYRCATAIRPGHMIEIARGGTWGGEMARHAACQTEREQAIAPYDHEKQQYVKGPMDTPEAAKPKDWRNEPNWRQARAKYAVELANKVREATHDLEPQSVDGGCVAGSEQSTHIGNSADGIETTAAVPVSIPDATGDSSHGD